METLEATYKNRICNLGVLKCLGIHCPKHLILARKIALAHQLHKPAISVSSLKSRLGGFIKKILSTVYVCQNWEEIINLIELNVNNLYEMKSLYRMKNYISDRFSDKKMFLRILSFCKTPTHLLHFSEEVIKEDNRNRAMLLIATELNLNNNVNSLTISTLLMLKLSFSCASQTLKIF